MNDLVLSPKTKDLLSVMKASALPEGTYLAGGTAIALHLGHRISNDLDFFTSHEFVESAWEGRLEKEIDLKIVKKDWQTIIGSARGVKFSLFYYKTPLIEKTELFYDIPIASIKDLGVIKLDVITSRGTKRDLIDIYFIAKAYGLSEMFAWYEKKYKNLLDRQLMIKKALVYFNDAEEDEMPQMIIPCEWVDVKNFLQKEVSQMK